ncbi:MAG TPA: radical SAM protein [Clostridia bacterium]|nr:radical SAM protein [Clostridia bacterium]
MIIPDYFIIEPTRVCNFSCFMCPNRFYKQNEKGHMELLTYTKIINQIAPYAKAIQLYWMGEPLLHPHILDFIKIAKRETKANVIVSTNGSLLTPNFSDALLNTGIDKLIIDVDASSPVTYSKVRRGGDYSSLVASIKYLLAKNQNTDIILQFLDFKINRADLPGFFSQWEDEPCSLRVDWIDTWAGQMPELASLAYSISPYFGETRMPCADLWHKATINYLGEINLCCHDYKRIHSFGNIIDTDLIKIWNSIELNVIRESHLLGVFNGLCKNCIEWAKESEYEELMV